RSLSGLVSERRPKRAAWSCRFSPSSCSIFCSSAAMRFRESRWRLCQYPTCWRSSRFSRCKRSTSARNSTTSRLEFSTESNNSGEEPLGQQTCTSWLIITTLVYRDGRDLGRGEFLLSTTDRPVRTGSAKLYKEPATSPCFQWL